MHHPDSSWPMSPGALFLRATLYLLIIGAIAQGAYLEATQLPGLRFSELGLTEFTQSTFLALSCGLLLYVRQRLHVWPYVTLLLLAFVASSLVREQDALLDKYVAEHAWKVLVALIILPSLYLIARHWRGFLAELGEYANSFSLGMFTAGFLSTYIFSRLYGRKDFWQAVMGDGYIGTVKSMAEEVVELLGYSLILFAMIELVLLARRVHRARQQAALKH